MSPDLGLMLKHCASEGGAKPLSCVAAVAASLPAGSRVRAAHRTFMALPAAQQRRAAGNPLAAARYVAIKLACRRVPSQGRAAWGVIDNGEGGQAFAASNGVAWYARCPAGVAKVHPSRVVAAWEVI